MQHSSSKNSDPNTVKEMLNIAPYKMNTDLQPWLRIRILLLTVCSPEPQIPIANNLLDQKVKTSTIFVISLRAWKASWRSKTITLHFNNQIFQNLCSGSGFMNYDCKTPSETLR
jgi:hypothetical protein